MKIEFELFDLAVDKIRNPIAYYVELLKDRLVYYLEAEIEKEPNVEAEEYESKEMYLCETRVFKRSALVGAAISYTKPFEEEVYVVVIDIMGADPIEVTFNKKRAAHKFHKQMLEYIFNEDTSVCDNSK